jgi:cellulose biosynthesis protein BcsQ/uncharacterized membrane-anchored protein YhcB (DUF1043 family)
MSLLEIVRLLAELIRRGADHIATFVVGCVVGVTILWYFSPWFRKRRRKHQGELDKLRNTVDALTHDLENSAEVKAELESDNKSLRQQLKNHEDSLANTNVELSSLQEQVADLTEQMECFANFDGKLWERPIVGSIPRFQPLAERKVPIIAVANLKGGVGKTTLTASLGAVLWQKGYRVLLVDLDYQGSLTSLCLSGQQISDLRRRGRLVESFFRKAHDSTPDEFLDYADRIQTTQGRLVAADEELGDVEMQLMARWFLKTSSKDVRYLLRQALHSSKIVEEVDIVLLDCPPRLTTSCINALAASDFVLVPVLLDLTSAEAVPRLLKSLRKLRAVACPDLSLLGVLGNRAFPRQELIDRENQTWQDLPAKCLDAWGESVYHFTTIIRQDSKFAEAATRQRFAALDPKLQATFLDLLSELKRRIPLHESRRTAVVY